MPPIFFPLKQIRIFFKYIISQDDDLSDGTLRYRGVCDDMKELEMTSKKALRQSLQEKLLVQQQCDELKVILTLVYYLALICI